MNDAAATAASGVRRAADPDARGADELAVVGKVVPAEGNFEAGDFWHACRQTDGSLLVVIGDVAGHGDAAHPLAEQLREHVATAALTATDPADVLTAVGRRAAIRDSAERELFATALALRLDPGSRELHCASAGHPVPYWLDDGEPVMPIAPGPPLCPDLPAAYTADRIPIGDRTGIVLSRTVSSTLAGPGGRGSARSGSSICCGPSPAAARRTPPRR